MREKGEFLQLVKSFPLDIKNIIDIEIIVLLSSSVKHPPSCFSLYFNSRYGSTHEIIRYTQYLHMATEDYFAFFNNL